MGCCGNVWGGLFRETQVHGQRPRLSSPYLYRFITHQHYTGLSHFGHTLTHQSTSPFLSLPLSPLLLLLTLFSLQPWVGEAHTEVAGWQLSPRSSQWKPASVCSCSRLLPAGSRGEKKMQWRSCRWRPWWVTYVFMLPHCRNKAAPTWW